MIDVFRLACGVCFAGRWGHKSCIEAWVRSKHLALPLMVCEERGPYGYNFVDGSERERCQ